MVRSELNSKSIKEGIFVISTQMTHVTHTQKLKISISPNNSSSSHIHINIQPTVQPTGRQSPLIESTIVSSSEEKSNQSQAIKLPSIEHSVKQPVDETVSIKLKRSSSSSLATREKDSSNDVKDEGKENLSLNELKYGAGHVIKLFVPVTLCMTFVVISISLLPFYTETDVYFVYTPFHGEGVDTTAKVWQSLGNALVLICVIIGMTFLLIFLYKYRFYKVIHTWLFVSSLILLTFFVYTYLLALMKAVDWPIDSISVLLFIWNFAFLGMLCIHWKGPLFLQQFYLIIISSLMALSLIKYMPNWTAWTALGVVAIWDLLAVLCPKGPLRILVELAQERNESLFPALIYSSGVSYMLNIANVNVNDSNSPNCIENNSNSASSSGCLQNAISTCNSLENVSPTDKTSINTSQLKVEPQGVNKNEDSEEESIKLGLGDFIFYSVLVGKASSYGNWNATVACFISILIGLCLTLILLAIFKKALPALPISIALGLVFYFLTSFFLPPFINKLANRQAFL